MSSTLPKKVIKVISDPGHAWAVVPRSEINRLDIANKISTYSYQNNNTVYLEEDEDLGIYVEALQLTSDQIILNEEHQENCAIRQFQSYRVQE